MCKAGWRAPKPLKSRTNEADAQFHAQDAPQLSPRLLGVSDATRPILGGRFEGSCGTGNGGVGNLGKPKKQRPVVWNHPHLHGRRILVPELFSRCLGPASCAWRDGGGCRVVEALDDAPVGQGLLGIDGVVWQRSVGEFVVAQGVDGACLSGQCRPYGPCRSFERHRCPCRGVQPILFGDGEHPDQAAS